MELQEQIHRELKRLRGTDDAFGWLASPQPELGMRIPARMIATGEGTAVLQALRGSAVEGELLAI